MQEERERKKENDPADDANAPQVNPNAYAELEGQASTVPTAPFPPPCNAQQQLINLFQKGAQGRSRNASQKKLQWFLPSVKGLGPSFPC